MTTTATRAPADQVDVPKLISLLVQSAKSDRDRRAAQALAEEETLLARRGVRAALVVLRAGRMTAHWEGLPGSLYTLSLGEAQRAILRLADNDRIAIGPHL